MRDLSLSLRCVLFVVFIFISMVSDANSVKTIKTPDRAPTASQLAELVESSKPFRKKHLHLGSRLRYGESALPAEDHITSGGQLSPLEAFYDVKSYEINLRVDPTTKSIGGFTDITIVTESLRDQVQFDLLNTFHISSIRLIERPSNSGVSKLQNFVHSNNSIIIDSDLSEIGKYKYRISYSGRPIVATFPPWVGGFTWARTEQDTHWIGLSCEGEGGKIWFPVKDHPSDEADEVTLKISGPKGLFVAANGNLVAIDETDPNWSTYTWKTLSSISNYAINFTIGDFDVTRGEHRFGGIATPVVFYGLKETQSTDDIEGDLRTLQERKNDLLNYGIQYLDFFTRNFGPFPFSEEKMAYVHTPYVGMEHQTAIAYGGGFKAQYTMDYISNSRSAILLSTGGRFVAFKKYLFAKLPIA